MISADVSPGKHHILELGGAACEFPAGGMLPPLAGGVVRRSEGRDLRRYGCSARVPWLDDGIPSGGLLHAGARDLAGDRLRLVWIGIDALRYWSGAFLLACCSMRAILRGSAQSGQERNCLCLIQQRLPLAGKGHVRLASEICAWEGSQVYCPVAIPCAARTAAGTMPPKSLYVQGPPSCCLPCRAGRWV